MKEFISNMKDVLSYYQILQVATDADSETIKRSYRDLAKIWHPDNNQDKDTTDFFQKLSVAYDILGDNKSRLIYDIMSLVYQASNYPDMETITPYKDDGNGVDVNALTLESFQSWITGYKYDNKTKIANYREALKLSAIISAKNWLLGWWHHKTFIRNFKAIINNLKNPISEKESLRLLIHNMIAYAKEGENLASTKCALRAKEHLNSIEKSYIDRFIANLGVKTVKPKDWNVLNLRLAQLIVPIAMFVLLFFSSVGGVLNVTESELWSIFSKNKKIDYYQTVDFGKRGRSVDDVVVGKIVSVAVNKSDISGLYHLKKESKIMYGPSDEFDIIKVLKDNTTVRLTGYTPDKVWARVMIDNGEIGFVYFEDIEQGIGKEIPYGSSIID